MCEIVSEEETLDEVVELTLLFDADDWELLPPISEDPVDNGFDLQSPAYFGQSILACSALDKYATSVTLFAES